MYIRELQQWGGDESSIADMADVEDSSLYEELKNAGCEFEEDEESDQDYL